jgi:hypothetical protein
MEDALAVSLATILSSESQGDPLWLFIVAPSGTGKSLLLESGLDSEQCVYRTSVGCKDFLSGYKGEGNDPSLINQLVSPQKCLLIKDYTGVITLPHYELDQLYGIFRDAYDGRVARSWGNGVQREYHGYFSVLAGVTPKIHTLNHTALGERFIKFQLASRTNVNQSQSILAAIGDSNTADDSENKEYRKESVRSFLHYKLHHNHAIKTPTRTQRERLAHLAQFISICRARVERDRDGAVSYEASPESGTRLGKQLYKMLIYLCRVYGLARPNEKSMNLVAKVAWDTAYDRKRTGYAALYRNPEGLDRHTFAKLIDSPLNTGTRTLEDFRELNVCYREEEGVESDAEMAEEGPKARKGRPKHIYKLTDEAADIFKSCGF